MADLLIAEDDPGIREWLELVLRKEGHRVRSVADGNAALVAYAERRPDMVILDVMMPGKSGYDVCAEIRRKDGQTAVIMLSANGTEQDKVTGLGIGADDYIVKPFGVAELKARVLALLRRAHPAPGVGDAEMIKVGTHVVDCAAHRLRAADGTETDLTPLELGLVRFLAAHCGKAVSRDVLLNSLWGVAYMGTTRTLDQRVNLLRKKLGDDADRVETIYGTGYRLRQD
jgi:DNA-binding response OmpR family regulator